MPDWDIVYADKTPESATPAEVLSQNQHLLENSGEALDFACGMAANGILLESKGYKVSAWDLSAIAVDKVNEFSVSKNIEIQAEKNDLEKKLPDMPGRFDVIVVSYFLHRPGLRSLYDLLKNNGLLYYQTFSGEQVNGVGPSRSEFRLDRGELLEVFSDMQLLYYREDHHGGAGSQYGQVSFVAKK